ncbi:hypothetical protein ACFLXO_03125 [Chloroflexota bacterium]
MFEWLKQPIGKSKKKAEQPQPKEPRDLSEEEKVWQQPPSDAVRALLKTAIADAEQIVESIKMRAQTEAEAEAARIIAQAKLEVEEIKKRAEAAAQKTDITVEEKAEMPVQLQEEIKGKTKKSGKTKEETIKETKEEVEEPIQPKEEAPEEKMAEPALYTEEAIEEKIEEPVLPKEEAPEKRASEVKGDAALLKMDSQALYAGEVELTIASQAELHLVSRLYSHLQTIPELKILYTKGSWDKGTAIAVVLEKPLPLIGLLSEVPGVAVTPELLEKDTLMKGKSGPLPREGGKEAKRIKLILKET